MFSNSVGETTPPPSTSDSAYGRNDYYPGIAVVGFLVGGLLGAMAFSITYRLARFFSGDALPEEPFRRRRGPEL